MSKLIDIPLEKLTHEAFAPFGQIVGELPGTPGWARPLLDAWKMTFAIEGKAELRVMRYHHQALEFHLLERHLAVTESRVPMGGAQAVMVVAPPTPVGRPTKAPDPASLRAFHIDGTVGLMLWRGTWHALDCFPLKPPFADFAFITEVETEDEIETSKDPIDGKRTQLVDFQALADTRFRVVDSQGLVDRSTARS